MNYDEMSDFEINSAVHNHVKQLGYNIEFLGGDRIKWSKNGFDDAITEKVKYSNSTLLDYCNNCKEAWKIIVENRISINFDLDEMNTATAFSSKSYGWFDKNPLRAAMIVFLVIKDECK